MYITSSVKHHKLHANDSPEIQIATAAKAEHAKPNPPSRNNQAQNAQKTKSETTRLQPQKLSKQFTLNPEPLTCTVRLHTLYPGTQESA